MDPYPALLGLVETSDNREVSVKMEISPSLGFPEYQKHRNSIYTRLSTVWASGSLSGGSAL